MSHAPLRNTRAATAAAAPEVPTPCVDPNHTGRGDPKQRFRLYRLCACQECAGSGKTTTTGRTQYTTGTIVVRCKDCRGEGSSLDLIATCGTPEAVGVALITLAREDELDGCPIGILDDQGDTGHKWLVRPWMASPRNVRDAAKLMQKQRTY